MLHKMGLENQVMYCEMCDRFEDDEICGECGALIFPVEADNCSHCNKQDLVELQINGMCQTCAEDLGAIQ